jgi:hypothetical protein
MDRGLMLPDRALGQAMARMATRTIAVQRRMRWPGNVQLEEDDGPLTIDAAPTWTTLLVLDLDPGRWLISAGYDVTETHVGGDAIVYEEARLFTIAETSPVVTSQSPKFGLGEVAPGTGLILVWTTSQQAPFSVSLQARHPATVSAADATNAYLFAGPG